MRAHARSIATRSKSFETIGDRPEVARVQCEMGWTELAAKDARSAQSRVPAGRAIL